MRNTLNVGFILVGVMLAMSSAPVRAINKCTDASGQVTYTDQPCPAATRPETLALPADSTTPSAPKTTTANSGAPVRTFDANTAKEADLSTIVDPATAAQIVSERKKARFTGWPDIVNRVNGLRTAQTAFFASLRGLTVSGQSLPGAAANPALADQFQARLRGGH